MKRVYYLTSEKYALCDLKHRHIKVARFNDLNDPFELIDVELSEPDVRERFRRWKREVNAECGLMCFSATWGNPVLWSHYADKHKGMCLGFDVPESELHEVEYLDRRRRLTDLVSKTAQSGPLLCTKFRDWEYEDEYRRIINLAEARKHKDLHFWPFGPELVLREVITGARCKVTGKILNEAFADELKAVKLTRARLAFRRFQVVPNRQGWKRPEIRDKTE